MPFVTTVRGRVRPGPHIFIAIPCVSGDIPVPLFSSFFEGAQMLDAMGYNITLCTETGNCHVDDVRNSLVREFLKTDATDLVFIDDDVGFPPENLLAIVSPDRDIVAGVYPKKEFPASFPVLPIPGEIWADADGLVEVEGVPTGFLRIRRNVLETLRDKAVSFIGQNGEDLPYHIIFERMVANNKRMSGDYAFCHKARAAGFKVHAAPELHFTHSGMHTWSGTLGDYWREKHGLVGDHRDERLQWGVEQLREGNAAPEVFEALCIGWHNEWSVEPDMLADLWRYAEGDVLECGSGLTTLVLAMKPGVRLTVLEHDPAFASHTTRMLALFGLEVDIRCAPLVGGWYDFAGGDFDAVVVDGPPRILGDRGIATERCTARTWFFDDVGGTPRHRVYDKLPEAA